MQQSYAHDTVTKTHGLHILGDVYDAVCKNVDCDLKPIPSRYGMRQPSKDGEQGKHHVRIRKGEMRNYKQNKRHSEISGFWNIEQESRVFTCAMQDY